MRFQGREIDFRDIRDFLFPDRNTFEPKLKEMLPSQATASLFLMIFSVSILSFFIYMLSLLAPIDRFQLGKSFLLFVPFFAIVLGIRFTSKAERKDYWLLLSTVVFVILWGVAKDIVNFSIHFNSFGIIFISLVFFGMVFMPFRPLSSLYLGLFTAITYLFLALVFVHQIFGFDWILAIGERLNISWVREHIRFMTSQEIEYMGIKTAWHTMLYLFFGIFAFIFRAANIRAYMKLSTQEKELSRLKKMLLSSESQHLEFKSSARWDYHQNKTNKTLEKVIIKTIAGFMNAEGGVLFIGVDDEGKPLGLQNDYNSLHKKDRDGFELFIVKLISDNLGRDRIADIDIDFIEYDDIEVCSLNVRPSEKPVFVKKEDQAFYVRTGNNTQNLNTKEALEYIERRF